MTKHRQTEHRAGIRGFHSQVLGNHVFENHSGSSGSELLGKKFLSLLMVGLLVGLASLFLPASSPASDRLESASAGVRRGLAKKTSITFKGIDTTEALKILTEESGINMAVSAGVRGSVTLFLTDVSIATALDLVTEMTGNAYIVEGDIVRVIPEADYVRETGNAFRSRKVLQVYTLEHARVQDALVATGQLGLLTSSGNILPDLEKNSLVVWDAPESQERISQLLDLIDRGNESGRVVISLENAGNEELLNAVLPHLTEGVGGAELLGLGEEIAITDLPSRMPFFRELVSHLDVSPQQVLMEVKILQVSYSDETSVGINWQIVQEKLNSFKIQSAYSVLPKTQSGDATSGSVLTIGDIEDDDFTVVMEALESYGSTDIVSLPRILALSGQEAKIHVGSSEPYVTVDTRESQGIVNIYERVTQVDVGVKLNITPQIHPNGFISMAVRPEVSSVARFEVTASGSSIPVVEQSTMETQVRVKSGVYVILGGLMKKELRKRDSGIPILRDIPVVKYLFGSTTVKEVRSELVIMIQPRIVTGDRAIEIEAGDGEESGE